MTFKPIWDRFVRFIAADGRELCGEPENADIDGKLSLGIDNRPIVMSSNGVLVGLALAANEPVQVKVLNVTSAMDENASFTGEVVAIKKLLSPISAKQAGTIRCIGMNYKDHVKEMKGTIPTVPEVFLKAPTCVLDPSEPIMLPKIAGDAVDGECELVAVIGKDCKNVSISSAMDYVLGYTIGNDVTARDVQAAILQWGYAKGYDGFCPLGPMLVSAKILGDPSNLALKTTVNGKILQNSNTSEMIFSVAEIISYLSRGTTLPKGTVILTGTPAGIGHSHTPPLYMKEGADVRISIGGGLGTLINSVVAEV